MYTCVHITCTFSYLSVGLLILSFYCKFYNDYNFPPILFLPHLPSCIYGEEILPQKNVRVIFLHTTVLLKSVTIVTK